nr:hypothetical protein [Candidatus Freyrarchaeum guaymaensis]
MGVGLATGWPWGGVFGCGAPGSPESPVRGVRLDVGECLTDQNTHYP